MNTHRLRTLTVVVLPAVMIGCGISAKSLRPIAEQNQTNTAELTRNVGAMHEIALAMVTANALVYVDGRVTEIDDELESVLDEASEELPPDSTWGNLFGDSGFKDAYLQSEAVLASGPDENIQVYAARKYGWIYTAAADPTTFTPQKAKQLQKQLTPIFDLDKSDRVKLVPKLFAEYDQELKFRVETAQGVRAILNALTQEIDKQLNAAQQYAARFANASEADLQLDKTIMGVLGSDEAKSLIAGLAKKHIGDTDVRNAVVSLFDGLGTAN